MPASGRRPPPGSDDDDDDDEDDEKEGENWFAGGERRYVISCRLSQPILRSWFAS